MRKDYIDWIIYGKRNIEILENNILQVTINYNNSELTISYNNTNNIIKLAKTRKTLLTNSKLIPEDNAVLLEPDTFLVQLL